MRGQSLSYEKAAELFPEYTPAAVAKRFVEIITLVTAAWRKEPPMPRILWLVSTATLPEAAAACGLSAAEVGGGWLTGMPDALGRLAADLTVMESR